MSIDTQEQALAEARKLNMKTIEAAFVNLHEAADALGPNAIELPDIERINRICVSTSAIQKGMKHVPATGHPSRYFEENGGPTRIEKCAYLKAIVCQFTDRAQIDEAISAVWQFHQDALILGTAKSPQDQESLEYSGLMVQRGADSWQNVLSEDRVEYHWLSDPMPRVFELVPGLSFAVIKFGALVVKKPHTPATPAPETEPAERPEQTHTPRFGFWHNKEWEGQPGEFEVMPDGPYVRHEDYVTACNNYEKLRTSHENLIEMVESVQNRLEIVEKWRGATWKEVRTEIWDDSFSAALANARALAEKMK